MDLTPTQHERYSRQVLLAGVGGNGQKKLLESSVLCVGTGGLGSAALSYLAAAGVGRLGLIDGDKVELSNLHRQIIHTTDDLGRVKVESARERLRALNPDVTIEVYPERLTADNAVEIVSKYDAVVDGCDNFPTRFLTNDACFFANRPLFFGSVLRFEGQATVFFPGRPDEPCYRCLFPEPPPPGYVPTTAEVGILGAVAGLIGTIQATECIKYLIGLGTNLNGRLLVYEALGTTFRPIEVNKDRCCRLCGDKPEITSLVEYETETPATPSSSP
ncbi:adenylyltransferase [candidate division BRC1 bacterium SM23_51]|nr:MAG: adenylyltransferase [candidate division BRC1 bacterium SM23_51]